MYVFCNIQAFVFRPVINDEKSTSNKIIFLVYKNLHLLLKYLHLCNVSSPPQGKYLLITNTQKNISL